MARILIVEDDLLIGKGLKAIINSINNKIEINITGYAKKALNYIKNANYDMFLLDIQLKDYSGFELAKEIRGIDHYKLTPIVFITAIPTRELMAFKEIHCYDYIVKPFQEEEVRDTLKTIINHGIMTKENIYLKLKQKDYFYIIEQDEIIYIEARNKKIFIITINETIDLSTYTLKQLLDELTTNFVQCHRGYIINLNYIEKIDRTNDDIYLCGIELPIPIGRKYRNYIGSRIYEFS
ncbi:LytR/AlgR family response regulator transcription factor [Anaerosalibacter massiliensis]|uniref:LytTR family DNA-binding domain-containing protein n=1 Tax=Anaerosalibacter massiliensis TaxID=1347392 RepID=A0A9X2MP47_9FIRM|nr:LytTR family DNA-binding domain-containing protein [Anaerosalibacter massiliensis]MCR2044586.1 LytTR family DNA-binding domain-containing protein [Anaerosalibacter massiliensis]